MADTVRTFAALQALLADNTSGDISPQDLRDFLASVFNWINTVAGGGGAISFTGGNVGIGIEPTDKLEARGANGTYIISSAIQSGGNNWCGFRIKSWISAAVAHWNIQAGSITGGATSLFAIATDTLNAMTIDATGKVGLGGGGSVPVMTAMLDINSDVIRLRTAKTPANAGAAGNAGDICWDATHLYICIAANTWRRIQHNTW